MPNLAKLKAQDVPLGKLVPHPDNPRKGDVDGIAASLQRFGQVRPLVVQQGTDVVVAGNHTLQAAQQLEWKTISIVRVDLDDAEARAFLVADNRLADVASYDDQSLVALLEQVSAEQGLEGTGFEMDDVEDLMSQLGQLPELPDAGTDAAHAPLDPSDTQRREQMVHEGANREVVFLLDKERFDSFRAMVAALKTSLDATAAADVIYTCVEKVHADNSEEETA